MLSEGLFIKSGGIYKKIVWDREKRSTHDVKRNEQKTYDIIDSDGNVVANYKTRNETDQYFYTEVKVKSFLQELKSYCYFEDKITLGDIFDLIDYNEEFALIVESIFPYYAQIQPPIKAVHNDEIIIGRYAKIESDKSFEMCVLKNLPASQCFASFPINFNKSFHISKNNSTIFSCNENNYTLLDLLYCLFADYHYQNVEVLLTKDGILEDGKLVENNMEHLFSICNIAPDVTLHDIMRFVDEDELLKEFIKFYSTCYCIDEYYQESKKPFLANEEDEYTEQTFLEVYPHFVASLDKKRSYFSPHFGFHGIKDDERYSNSMSPLNSYSHLPVKLQKETTIYFRDKNLNTSSTEDIKINYTLLDILDAIYDDISFHGNPDDRDAMLEGLKDTVEQIKEGTIETIPWEDLHKEFLEEEEDND